jgi:hypothetical protein
MLASDVLRRVRAWMGDEAGTFVDSGDVIDLINDAAIELNMEFKLLTGSTPLATVAGTAVNNLPADFMAPIRFSMGVHGNTLWLDQISKKSYIEQYQADADTALRRGSPRYFWIEGLEYGVFPTPDGVYNGTLYYVKTPTAITLEADTLPFPSWIHPKIARMVMAIMKERDEDFEAAQAIRNQLFSDIANMRHLIQTSGSGPTVIRSEWVDEY